jgi:hypothetical protein
MKKLLYAFVLSMILLSIIGCEKTGYRITIEASGVDYSVIQTLENILLQNGFYIATFRSNKGETLLWRERKVASSDDPREVYTLYYNKPASMGNTIEVYLYYSTGIPASDRRRLKCSIENVHKGLSVHEVRTGIDGISASLYEELIKAIGKDGITVERKEVSPPAVF